MADTLSRQTVSIEVVWVLITQLVQAMGSRNIVYCVNVQTFLVKCQH